MESKKKVYSKRAIKIGTFLGSPLAGGYLMANNYKVWGEKKSAKVSLISGLIATILLFTTILYLPNEIIEKIPNFVIPIIYTLIVGRLVDKYQQAKIQEHLENKHLKHSNWKAAGIGIIGCFLAAFLFLGLIYYQPLYPGDLKEYGPRNNQVFFDDSVKPILADKLAQSLTEFGYFSNDFQTAVHIGKRAEYYVVTLPLQKEHWDNKQIKKTFYELKESIKAEFSTQKIIIRLHHFGFNEEFEEL